jgi:hypothetical protein
MKAPMVEALTGHGTQMVNMKEEISTYIVAVLKQSLVRWIPRLPHLRALELYDGNEVDDEVAQQLHACSPKFRALSIFGSVQASYAHCCRATSLPFNSLSKRLGRCWVLLEYNLSHLGFRYKISGTHFPMCTLSWMYKSVGPGKFYDYHTECPGLWPWGHSREFPHFKCKDFPLSFRKLNADNNTVAVPNMILKCRTSSLE